MEKVNKKSLIIIDAVLFVLLTALDQFTKVLATTNLKDQPDFPIIPDVLELHYLENYGAAFSMLQNQKIFFIFIAVVILAAICFVLYKMPAMKKYTALHILSSLIAAGAVGNMIDRFKNDFVVDFIYAKFINFPVFNVADIYITCSAIALFLVIIFKYKDNDLKFLSVKIKKTRDIDKINQENQKSNEHTEE